MRKVKKILQYFGVYVFVTVAVAITVVIANGGNDKKQSSLVGTIVSGVTSMSDPVVSSIVSSFIKSDTIVADIELDLDKDGKSVVSCNGEFSMDMSHGLMNGAMKMDANIAAVGITADCEVYYLTDGYLYFVLADGTYYKLELSKIVDTNLLYSLMAGADNGNSSSLVGILSNVKVTKLDNSYRVDVPMKNGDVYILCDSEYKIDTIVISDMTFAGFTLNAGLKMKDAKANFALPADKTAFNDLTPQFDASKMLAKYIEEKSFAFEFNANVKGLDFSGNGAVDFRNGFAVQFDMSVGGVPASIIIKDEQLYANVNGLRIKGSMEDLVTLTNFALKYISEDQLQLLVGDISDLMQSMIGQALSNQFTTKTIDNSIILSWSSNKIEIITDGTSVESMTLSMKGITADFAMREVSKEVSVVENEYINIMKMIPAVEKTIDAVIDTQLSGMISTSIAKRPVVAKYSISFTGGLKAHIIGTFDGLDFSIFINDGTYYVLVDGIKMALKEHEIPTLINWIEDKFDCDLPEFDLSYWTSFGIKDCLDDKALSDVKDFFEIIKKHSLGVKWTSFASNKLTLAMKNGSFVGIHFDEMVDNVSFKMDSISVQMSIDSQKPVIEPNTNYEYLTLNDFFETFDKVVAPLSGVSGNIDIDMNNVLGLKLTANYKFAFIDQKIVLDLSARLLNKDLKLNIRNDKVFIEYDKFKCQITTKEIKALISKFPNLKIESLFDLKNFNLNNVSLSYDTNSFELEYDNKCISVLTDTTSITSITADIDEYNINISTNVATQTFDSIDELSYIKYNAIKNTIVGIVDLISSKNVGFVASGLLLKDEILTAKLSANAYLEDLLTDPVAVLDTQIKKASFTSNGLEYSDAYDISVVYAKEEIYAQLFDNTPFVIGLETLLPNGLLLDDTKFAINGFTINATSITINMCNNITIKCNFLFGKLLSIEILNVTYKNYSITNFTIRPSATISMQDIESRIPTSAIRVDGLYDLIQPIKNFDLTKTQYHIEGTMNVKVDLNSWISMALSEMKLTVDIDLSNLDNLKMTMRIDNIPVAFIKIGDSCLGTIDAELDAKYDGCKYSEYRSCIIEMENNKLKVSRVINVMVNGKWTEVVEKTGSWRFVDMQEKWTEMAALGFGLTELSIGVMEGIVPPFEDLIDDAMTMWPTNVLHNNNETSIWLETNGSELSNIWLKIWTNNNNIDSIDCGATINGKLVISISNMTIE